MTEEERLEEDKKLGKFDEKDKPKWKFMQVRYYLTNYCILFGFDSCKMYNIYYQYLIIVEILSQRCILYG